MRGGKLRSLATVAVAVAAVFGLPAPAGADSGRPTATPNGVTGVMQRHAGRAGHFAAPSNAATIGGQLIAHGGPVMATHTVYAMYWFPAGYTLDSSWKGIVDGYLANVAADTGTTSNVFSAGNQYGARYDAAYGGSAVDTTPFPANGCNATTGPITVCLSESQIFDELKAFVAAQGWPTDGVAAPGSPTGHPTHLVMVYLPPNVADCWDAPYDQYCSADSSRQYYCAYHTAWVTSTTTYVWANMPYTWSLGGCQGGSFPSGNAAADTAVDVTSHEYIEALTDPYLNAWFDAGGYEIADKCQLDYGTNLGAIAGRGYNQTIGGGTYYTQLEYSNKRQDCYQLGPPTVTTFAPLAGAVGDTIDIHGTNFFGPVVVKFNGIASGAVTVDSPTELHVALPAGNVKGKITVQALGGAGTSATGFAPPPTLTSFDPLDGPAGTVVTVTGTALSGATAVRFGTRTASFTPVSDSELTAIVPGGLTGGRITIVTPGGSGVSKSGFYVTRISGITPAAAAAGKVLTITGQGLGSTTSVRFQHHGDTTPESVTATQVKVKVPNDADLGAITIVTPRVALGGPVFKPLPSVASLSPLDGSVGTTVTIDGANLDGVTAVKFGSAVATNLNLVSPTEVKADVPPGFASSRITVVGPAGHGTSAQTFGITRVTTISPAAAAGASTITINGVGLGSTTTVDFGGGVPVTPSSVTATAVKVVVPPNAQIGALTVHTPNIGPAGATTASSFKPLPRITGFGTNPNQAGDTVTVEGTNLYEPGTLRAKLGAVAVSAGVAPGSPSFDLQIPDAGVTGTVTFANAAGATTSTAKLLIRPTIQGDPSPAHGASGTPVTLTGKTFVGTRSVSFNGGSTPFTVGAGGTTLTVRVPAAAVSGPIVVQNAGGETSSTAFTVDPRITGFTTAGGRVGAALTIRGTGLAGADRVDFAGGVSATPATTAPTAVQVVVPPGAVSGPVTVHAGGQTAVSPGSFTVTLSVTGFSPAAATYDRHVTLNGVGLTGVTAVTFDGLPGAVDSIAADGTSMVVSTPASGDLNGPIRITKGSATIAAPHDFVQFELVTVAPVSGGAGDSLTISGSGFTGVTSVRVGTADADFTVDSDTQISAVVPESGVTPGATTISVAGSGGALSTAFTVVVPAVSELTPATGAPGAVVTLAGHGLGGATAVVFDPAGSAVHATTFSVDSPSQITVTVPAGATTGPIRVVNAVGSGDSSSSFTVLVSHSNGLGQTFEDSSPLGTYTATSAQEAAEAWLASTGAAAVSKGAAICGSGASQFDVYFVETAGQAAAWAFDNPGDLSSAPQGHVALNASGTTVVCPQGSDPGWN